MRPTADRPVRSGRRLRVRLSALLAAIGLVAVIGAAQTTGSTEASWDDSEHGELVMTAGTLGPPVAAGCNAVGTTFTARWTPPVEPSITPSEYEVYLLWDPLLLGPDVVVKDWENVGTAQQLDYSMPPTLIAAGTYRFQARAVDGSWESSPIAGTATVLLSLLGVVSISGCSWS